MLVATALAYPIEEHASDAATVHVYREVLFSAGREAGWVYPRWSQAIYGGLGGPLFSFYSPLVYELTDALHAVGIAHPLAWRLVVALAFVLASTGAFGLGLALFGRVEAALVAAAVFTYAPHLSREHFERGSPEGLAIALAPWLLWALLRLAAQPSGSRLALAAACWALVILAHNLAALLLLPFLGLFLAYLLLRDGPRPVAGGLLALGGGVLLAAFYLVPFLAEVGDVRLDNASLVPFTRPAENALPLADLLAPLTILDAGLGNNTLGHSIGPIQALALAAGPLLGLRLWRRQRATALLVAGLSGLGLLALWLQTDAATALWTAVPAASLMQFRFRLLSYLGLAAAVIAGLAFVYWPASRRACRLLAGLLVAAAIGLQLPALLPSLLQPRNHFPPEPTVADAQAWELAGPYPGLTFFDEFRPRWRTQPLTAEEARRAAANPIANLPSGARISLDERRDGAWRIGLETPRRFRAALSLLYFPGWTGYVDGIPRPLQPLEGPGYAEVEIPAGAHSLELRYEGTLAQQAGAVVSGLAVALVGLLALLWRGAPALAPGSVRLGQAGQPPPPGSARRAVPAPAWRPAMLVLPLGLVLLALLKVGWVDPRTTLLRRASTCEATVGAGAQTEVAFGDGVQLCGYSLDSTSFRPGDELSLTLFWRRETSAQAASSFVHLLGSRLNPDTGNPLWGQQDKDAPGQYPLTQWVPGKLYRDTYTFRIPSSTPLGAYQLEIGWWDPASGQRLRPRLARPAEGLSVSDLGALLVSGIEVRH